jgi:phage gpG-like protein
VYAFQVAWMIGKGPEQVARDLFRLSRGVHHDTRGLLTRAVDEVMRPSISENFAADGRPPWEPLTEPTQERRERAGYTPDDPLTASGAGERSATARARWSITADRAEYSGASFPESTWTMALHEVGEQSGHFPARPYAVVQPEDADAMGRLAGDWFDRKRRRAGF